MSNDRPKVGHSNITYYAIQQRKVIKKPIIEVLPDPVPVPETNVFSIMDRIQVCKLPDTFCPPDLTKVDDGLYYKGKQQPTKETQ
jgi:hypothetical protein|tara:strand:+ start:386 stop:640 length:255 start_codon:yes stop_codon:yes gene_type:complete